MEGLVAHDLSKWFKHRKVVDSVSLDIQRGEVVGLLGPNGAGKTTSFYMMVGLLPADRGQIFLEGEEITRLPMYQRCRRGVGHLPQEASVCRWRRGWARARGRGPAAPAPGASRGGAVHGHRSDRDRRHPGDRGALAR